LWPTAKGTVRSDSDDPNVEQGSQVVPSRDVSLPFDPAENLDSPFPPLDRAWVTKVQALSPVQQLEAVAAELKRRNPGFDGKIDGSMTELGLGVDNVVDLTPVRVLTRLKSLRCIGSHGGTGAPGKGRLAELLPLRGMKLTALWCSCTQVSDLTPLKGMPLTILHCNVTPVSDLTPLKGMPLTIYRRSRACR
jgi:hypothetical protein